MVLRASIFPTFFTVLMFLFCFLETLESKNFLKRGSSLSVEDNSDVLTSPDKTFTCGFYDLGENALWLSIWFTSTEDRTVVWTANRDRPVNSRGSRASLRRNGAMVLTDVDGTIVWITNTTDTSATRAELLDTGNLVLKDVHGKVLWQSFDFPTDTLLPNQPFGRSTKLISRLEIGNFASGYFSLYFDSDNVLKMMYDGPDISSVYWPNPDFDRFQNGRTIYNSSRTGFLDGMGIFLSSDKFQFCAIDMGFGIKRRLTMDYDGNLRLYSPNDETGSWMISWQALVGQCKAHGVCGKYGICVYTHTPAPYCTCPPGYEVSEPGNWNKGCKPKFNRTCSGSLQVKFIKVPHVDYYGFDLNYNIGLSMDSCMKLCVEDCQCEAYSYRLTGEGRCYTKGLLYNGYYSPSFPGDIYLKYPVSVEASEPSILKSTNLMCQSGESEIVYGSPSMYETTGKRKRWKYIYWFALAIGAIEALFITLGWWLLLRKQVLPSSVEDGHRAISSQFRRFSYSELKKATKNFTERLGRGSSGAVFKGVLTDERVVAVKRLENFYQGGEEVFWAEVSTVAKIYHMNLLRMWGFCSEGRHRLVVYEYVENQSLDRHLFASDFLGWKERFQVALGTAKGLAYLHHECLEWVIHCDVKPENILLDSEFQPKIADFGLAKLSQRGSNNSQFSQIRGTKGYMAPEWASNLPITAKVDVYGYGVVILEMVKGIRLSKWMVEDNEEQEVGLTRYVREVKSKLLSGEEAWIEEMVDPRLNGNFNKNQATKLVEIGISCVEDDRSKRPTMDSVVQSLLECESEARNPHNH